MMNDKQSDIHLLWHAKSSEDVMQSLETSEEGLSDCEAGERLTYYGTNELQRKQKKSIGKMLLEQVTDVMVPILVGASILSISNIPEGLPATATIGAFQVGMHMEGYAVGMTMAFLVLSISQLLHALNQRSNTESIFSTGNGHNPHLLISIIASALVLMLILLVPYFRTVISLCLLTAAEWWIVLLFFVLPLVAVEISKLLIRCTGRKS